MSEQQLQKTKRCPLRRYQDLNETIFNECYGTECAWWSGDGNMGGCVAVSLGVLADDLYFRQVGRGY